MSNTEITNRPQAPWSNVYAKPGTLVDLGHFVSMLRKFAEQGHTVPVGVDIGRLSAACVTAARKVPKLLNCTYMSWAKAISDAYTWGLDPLRKEVWFIPYGSEVQCIVGYQGLLALARRHPDFVSIKADVVPLVEWEAGNVEVSLDPWFFKRGFMLREDDAGGYAFAYCIAKYKANGEVVEEGHILQWFEIVKRAEQSKNCIWDQEQKRFVGKTGDDGGERASPWTLWTREMARKSVLAAFLRSGQVPMSADAMAALDREDELQTQLAASTAAKPATNAEAAQRLLTEEPVGAAPDFQAENDRLAAAKAPVLVTPTPQALNERLQALSEQGYLDAFEQAGLRDAMGVPLDELTARQRERLAAVLNGVK